METRSSHSMAEVTANTSATTRTLTTVELLRLILESVSDIKTLSACVRVCRLWQDIAASILWRGSERRDTFNALHLERLAQNPDRFRHYLKYIRYLNLESPEGRMENMRIWNPELWKGAQYRYVVCDLGSENMLQNHMEMLLHENLVAIEFFGGYYSDSFLTALERFCPHLRWLLIDDSSASITSHAMLRFLQNMPSLQGLELWHGFEFNLSEPVLIQIANMPRLQYLSLGQKTISADVFEASHYKLQRLRNLEIGDVHGPGIQTLLHRLEKLSFVQIALATPVTPFDLLDRILFSASRCSFLITLEISCHPPSDNVSPLALRAIAKNCPLLTCFTIDHTSEAEWFEGPHYAELVTDCLQYLSSLEKFAYDPPCRLEASDFLRLSISCPRLTSFRVRTTIDLDIFQSDDNENIHFPNLQSLEAYAFTAGYELAENNAFLLLDASTLEEGIREKFPRLINLTSDKDSENGLVKTTMQRINFRGEEQVQQPHTTGISRASILSEILSSEERLL